MIDGERSGEGANRDGGFAAVASLVLPTSAARIAFVTAAALVTLAYTVLLPFGFTQRFGIGNWHYLSPLMAVFSVAYGIGLAWVVACQVAAVRHLARAREQGLGVVGAVAGVLPSLLCCTPVVPTVLGAFGVSGISLITTSGHIQGFFGRNETWIELGGLAVLIASAVWSVHKLRTAACITGSCEIATSPCDVDTKTQGVGTRMGDSSP